MSASISEEEKKRHSFEDKQASPSVSTYDEEASVNEGTLESYLAEQLAAEDGNGIKYRTCGLWKTTALVFSEYSCLAIVSFPGAYSTLGLIPGIMITVGIALISLYTGQVIWRFCLKHPKILDVCDIAKIVFFDSKIAWYFTAVCFVLNNVFLMGLHLLTWSQFLNTVAGYPFCTIISTLLALVLCYVCSIPRTLGNLSWLAVFSAVTMFFSAILCIVFAAIQTNPGHYVEGTPIEWGLWPKSETTFAQGCGAAVSLVFVFVGQVTYPNLITEMKDPRQFHISLKLVCVAQIIVFVAVGTGVYICVGDAYITSPAFGSLTTNYKYATFALAVPTVVFLGVLYCSITSKLLFYKFFAGTKHLTQNTVAGWAGWCGIVLGLWVLGLIVCLSIPFFSDLISLMSSLFVSYFGFILLGMCYIYMRAKEGGKGWYKRLSKWGYAMVAWNVFIIILGFILLGPGTYSTISNILDAFADGTVGSAFSCADNSI